MLKVEEIKITEKNIDKVKDLIKNHDNLMLKYIHNENDSFQAQMLKDGMYYEVIITKNGHKSNTQMDLDDLVQWITWRFQDSFSSLGDIKVYLFATYQTMKGTKTAVWGKKSHRDDLASALSNNFRKML